jgi:hypothetical protein
MLEGMGTSRGTLGWRMAVWELFRLMQIGTIANWEGCTAKSDIEMRLEEPTAGPLDRPSGCGCDKQRALRGWSFSVLGAKGRVS